MKEQYKFLNFFAMFYLTIKLITILIIYKIISFGLIKTTAATLIIPLWFLTSDIITEVYGYKISKQIIWIAILCQFIFALTCASIIKIDSPTEFIYQSSYEHVFGNLPRVAFASFLAILLSAFINAKVLARWKILLQGKYFWLRSLGASAIGEAIFTFVAYIIEFFGIVPAIVMFELMLTSFITKVIVGIILVAPLSFLTTLLKRAEDIDDTVSVVIKA